MAAFMLGRIFHKAFHRQENASRSVRILLMALTSVMLVHIMGVAYLTGLALFGQIPWHEWPGWVLRLTIETAPYDFLATGIFLCMVRQFRLGLWLVLY
jgi:hypothetical protein